MIVHKSGEQQRCMLQDMETSNRASLNHRKLPKAKVRNQYCWSVFVWFWYSIKIVYKLYEECYDFVQLEGA